VAKGIRLDNADPENGTLTDHVLNFFNLGCPLAISKVMKQTMVTFVQNLAKAVV